MNAQKSAVDRPRNRKFLGFTVTRGDARIKVAAKAIESFKTKIRELTRRTRGHRLADIVQELKTALTGWKAYFGITEVLIPLREIDKWVRYAATHGSNGAARATANSESVGSACARLGTQARARMVHGG